jgi:hypothetical protein
MADEHFPKEFPEDKIPHECFCPITQEIMEDPVIVSDGHTYERVAIKKWFEMGKNSSPKTNKLLPNKSLQSNYAMKSLIQDLKKSIPELEAHKLLDEQSISVAIKLRETDLEQVVLEKKNILIENQKMKENFDDIAKKIEDSLEKKFENRFSQQQTQILQLQTTNQNLTDQIVQQQTQIVQLQTTNQNITAQVSQRQVQSVQSQTARQNVTANTTISALKSSYSVQTDSYVDLWVSTRNTAKYYFSCETNEVQEERLRLAAKEGNIEHIRDLVLNGRVNINGRGFKGSICSLFNGIYALTPLLVAIYYGQDEAAKELINLGALVNQTDSNGKNALNYAQDYGRNDVFNYINNKQHIENNLNFCR